MAPLTYNRLLARLNAHFDALPALFPHPTDEPRLHDVMRALISGQISAQRGVAGEGHEILSPGQLKRWVVAKVAKIHEYYDTIDATQVSQLSGGIYVDGARDSDAVQSVEMEVEMQSPNSESNKENKNTNGQMPPPRPRTSAVTKRIIRGNETYAGVKKTASKPTRNSTRTRTRIAATKSGAAAVVKSMSDREAAAALMKLYDASPAVGHERSAPAPTKPAQMEIPAGAYEAGAAPDDIFMAGVRYAMENYELVKRQMSGDGKGKSREFWDVV